MIILMMMSTFPIISEMMSMGTGKMIVLLFSAEMLFKVWRYLNWRKNNHDGHHGHHNNHHGHLQSRGAVDDHLGGVSQSPTCLVLSLGGDHLHKRSDYHDDQDHRNDHHHLVLSLGGDHLDGRKTCHLVCGHQDHCHYHRYLILIIIIIIIILILITLALAFLAASASAAIAL